MNPVCAAPLQPDPQKPRLTLCGMPRLSCPCEPCPAHDGMCNQCPKRPMPEPTPYRGAAPRPGRSDPEPSPLEVKHEDWVVFSRQSAQLPPLGGDELPLTPEPDNRAAIDPAAFAALGYCA